MSRQKTNKSKFPPWLRVQVKCGSAREEITEILDNLQLNTVCREAKCPNMAECWHKRTATFMIMGKECTRNCKFCGVSNQSPKNLEKDEPLRVAKAAYKMQLKYVVITSVTRDDLHDGGAKHFATTIREIKKLLPTSGVEVLTPDFMGKRELLDIVFNASPTVFNHNLETVKRLSPIIRPDADYERSLNVLKYAHSYENRSFLVKSGLMVGLGETDEEINETIEKLALSGVEILTIGQYLPPTENHYPLNRYVHPDKFKEWKEFALKTGIKKVFSAPLVRSSYMADSLVEDLLS
ncbi:MAG: lipoyl synthase [Verrucomicrobiota bacterium]|nr:lipoyl synthase [Verrucomicrobiota bacterium]